MNRSPSVRAITPSVDTIAVEDGDGVASDLEFESEQIVADLDRQRLPRFGGAVVDGDLRGERELEDGWPVLGGGHRDASTLDIGDARLDLLDELRCGGTVADRADVDECLGESFVASQVLRAFEVVAEHVEHDCIDLVGDFLGLVDRRAGRELGVDRDGNGILARREDRESERACNRTADHHHHDGERGEPSADRPTLRAVPGRVGSQTSGSYSEAPLDPCDRVADGALVDEEPPSDRGDEHDREEERQQQCDDHRRGDRADELTEDAPDEQHRREHDDGGECSRERGRSDPVDRGADHPDRFGTLALVGVDRLGDHDGVVDDEPEGENQAEQGDGVQREADAPEPGE